MRRSGWRAGQLEQADAAVGAGDAEDALGIFDVGGGGLERLGGEVAAVRDRRLRGDVDRRPGGEQRARARRCRTPSRGRCRPCTMRILLDRHAEHVDHKLRVGGRDALPHRHRRGIDLDLAVARDRDGDALLEGVAAGPFQERGEAAAAQLAARARRRLAGGEIVPFGERQRPGRGSSRNCRNRRPAPSRSCRASAPARSGCGGGFRPGRGRSAARRRRTGARSDRSPRAARRRDRPPVGAVWVSTASNVEIDRLDVVDAGARPTGRSSAG